MRQFICKDVHYIIISLAMEWTLLFDLSGPKQISIMLFFVCVCLERGGGGQRIRVGLGIGRDFDVKLQMINHRLKSVEVIRFN